MKLMRDAIALTAILLLTMVAYATAYGGIREAATVMIVEAIQQARAAVRRPG
jgi:predicted membrane protein